jgi:hypothetical protein
MLSNVIYYEDNILPFFLIDLALIILGSHFLTLQDHILEISVKMLDFFNTLKLYLKKRSTHVPSTPKSIIFTIYFASYLLCHIYKLDAWKLETKCTCTRWGFTTWITWISGATVNGAIFTKQKVVPFEILILKSVN